MFASIIVALMLVLGLTTTVIADGAKPGDALYSWDRGVEQVRLSLTIGDEARAKYEAQTAEERARESTAIETERPDDYPRVRAEAKQALEQALDTITHVQQEQTEKGNDRAADSLQQVGERLRTVKLEHEEDDDQPQNGNVNADDAVRNVNRDETEDDDSSDDSSDDDVVKNENVNASDDDETDATEIRVEVKREGPKAEIRTKVLGVEQEWELATTDTATILASISERTGLSTAVIQDVWKYSAE